MKGSKDCNIGRYGSDERAATIECDLARCAKGTDVAWNLSSALNSLDLAVKCDTPPISTVRCQNLIEALSLANREIVKQFPGSEQAQAAKGLDAAVGLILIWAEKPEQRAQRHPHVLLDMLDYARVLRNLAHNAALAEQIRERADKRRSETVTEILRKAAA